MYLLCFLRCLNFIIPYYFKCCPQFDCWVRDLQSGIFVCFSRIFKPGTENSLFQYNNQQYTFKYHTEDDLHSMRSYPIFPMINDSRMYSAHSNCIVLSSVTMTGTKKTNEFAYTHSLNAKDINVCLQNLLMSWQMYETILNKFESFTTCLELQLQVQVH